MAGRIMAGTGQLALALTGFVLLIGWWVMKMVEYYELMYDEPPPKNYAWLGEWGGMIFLAAWLWSLVTSISLLREAKQLKLAADQNAPPRIADVPDA